MTSTGGFPAERADAAERTRREMIALAYLAEHDMGEMTVRFDNIALVVANGNRAMVRHHIGCLTADAGMRIPEPLLEAA